MSIIILLGKIINFINTGRISTWFLIQKRANAISNAIVPRQGYDI
jgi:hypothetical protein